jgi:Rap1a immunity proteins
MDVIRFSFLVFYVTAALATVACVTAQAAVSRDQFPPRTTGDLVALCGAGKDDPLMTAAVNFCQGFAEGAVEVALGYESMARQNRKPFCLPTPGPSHNEALAQFAAWANAEPKRLDEPPGVGLIRFLVHQYPCPQPAMKRGQVK